MSRLGWWSCAKLTGHEQQERQRDAADRVDMRERIQGETAGPSRRVVTQPVGDVAVRDLVKDHGDEHRKDPQRDLQKLLAHVRDL
jgi:hypothetical protein